MAQGRPRLQNLKIMLKKTRQKSGTYVYCPAKDWVVFKKIWPKAGVKDPALGQMSNFFGRAFNV